jgi:hypothetical protein
MSLRRVSQGLMCDVSQAIDRRPWAYHLRTITTSSAIYNFTRDRTLLPQEILRVYGWSPDATNNTYEEVADLVGETMALPPLATILGSLLVAVGKGLPGLWE